MPASGAQDAWVRRVLGVATAPPDPRADATAAWKGLREVVLNSLRSVAATIAAEKHPSSAKAILEIQAVIKNVTAEPSSPQQISELRTYLDTDQVVNDVSDLADDIRTPLLHALDRLESVLVN